MTKASSDLRQSITWHSCWWTEEKHERPQSGLPVQGPRYEPGNSQIRARGVKHSTTTFGVNLTKTVKLIPSLSRILEIQCSYSVMTDVPRRPVHKYFVRELWLFPFQLRFQVLTATNMEIRAFWDISPCSLGVDRRFRGAYCLHRQGDEGWWLALRTSETSVYSNETTRRYIPEGSNLLPSQLFRFTIHSILCYNRSAEPQITHKMRDLQWTFPLICLTLRKRWPYNGDRGLRLGAVVVTYSTHVNRLPV
jgi:hypothetical protein